MTKLTKKAQKELLKQSQESYESQCYHKYCQGITVNVARYNYLKPYNTFITYAANKDGNCVYIGRGTAFGNPFIADEKLTSIKNPTDEEKEAIRINRIEICEQYKQYLIGNKSLVNKVKNQLKGKVLMCSCKKATVAFKEGWKDVNDIPCHGDILTEIANQNE